MKGEGWRFLRCKKKQKKSLLSPPSNVQLLSYFVKKDKSLTVERFRKDYPLLDEHRKIFFLNCLNLKNDNAWGSKFLIRTR